MPIVTDENSLEGSKVYLHYLDPYVQLTLPMAVSDVRRHFVVDCLTHDFAFTSLSHLLGSSVSTTLAAEYRLLLREAVVIPYMRNSPTVSHFVGDRLARYQAEDEVYRSCGLSLTNQEYARQVFDEVPSEQSSESVHALAARKVRLFEKTISVGVVHSPLTGMKAWKSELTERVLVPNPTHEQIRPFETEISNLREFVSDHMTDRLNRNLYTTLVRNRIADVALANRLLTDSMIGYLPSVDTQIQPLIDTAKPAIN